MTALWIPAGSALGLAEGASTGTFVVFLGVTLVLLGAVVVTGLRAMRRLHIGLVVAALISLTITIIQAERFGRHFDLESAGVITPFHLTLAKITTLAYLLPIITGIRTMRNPAGRSLHFKVAMLVLCLTLLTAVTGSMMILGSDPLPIAD
jgi:hypothetical protein